VAGSATDIPIADFERLFGPNGVYDMFFKSDLQNRVNTTRSPWTWLTDTSKVDVRFTVTPVYLDPGAGSVALEIDGQGIKYQYGPERPFPVTWPGQKPGLATASFAQSGGQTTPAFEGPWAWFRLIDSGQMAREGNERYILTIKRGMREARFRVEADSVRNPFSGTDLQRFRCE
jgi:type VI secretion system protein ImpL